MDVPPHDNPETAAGRDQTGFRKVSETLKRRTTDLLAVAILAMGCLAVGGKVGRWWNRPPEVLSTAPHPLAQPIRWNQKDGVSLEFGGLEYAIHHQTIQGNAKFVGDQLEQIAVAQLEKVSLPDAQPAAAEQKLVKELKNVPASRVLPSGESLYRFGPALPMVILTRPAEDDPEQNRVVCWARAFPQSADTWMVFLFHPAGENAAQPSGGSAVPLPENCRRIQSLADTGGQSWIGFRGPGPLAEWQRHFDDWFEKHGWMQIGSWSRMETSWTAAFQSNSGERAEIWLNSLAEECEGMVYTSPAPRPGE